MKNLLKPTKEKRLLFFLINDILLFSFSFYLSFLLKFDFSIPDNHLKTFYYWLPFVLFLKIFTFWLSGIYKVNWRFIGLNEFSRIVVGLGVDTTIMSFFNLLLRERTLLFSIPLGVILIDFFVSFFFASLMRISKRVYLEIFRGGKDSKRAVVIGAGNTGERIVRELK